ncbi:uncharacterized protein LAESUDRAFT_717313 [Laetiporus sulphureus 93-53]|uniref:Uncharacterized protein n=1 Tax=Laetiporus sulphureus 93-53 TaxID=1314785 RepID=A0A165BVJ8_9APHY|nr:uncharacterized protein LAESUDRAFT_717313 [Laetiporus sulphureus 93-53]KZT01730.1 hypothetical protein LAESUDRAFT_717313 [Laetiporus sulphureus 93-53]
MTFLRGGCMSIVACYAVMQMLLHNSFASFKFAKCTECDVHSDPSHPDGVAAKSFVLPSEAGEYSNAKQVTCCAQPLAPGKPQAPTQDRGLHILPLQAPSFEHKYGTGEHAFKAAICWEDSAHSLGGGGQYRSTLIFSITRCVFLDSMTGFADDGVLVHFSGTGGRGKAEAYEDTVSALLLRGMDMSARSTQKLNLMLHGWRRWTDRDWTLAGEKVRASPPSQCNGSRRRATVSTAGEQVCRRDHRGLSEGCSKGLTTSQVGEDVEFVLEHLNIVGGFAASPFLSLAVAGHLPNGRGRCSRVGHMNYISLQLLRKDVHGALYRSIETSVAIATILPPKSHREELQGHQERPRRVRSPTSFFILVDRPLTPIGTLSRSELSSSAPNRGEAICVPDVLRSHLSAWNDVFIT